MTTRGRLALSGTGAACWVAAMVAYLLVLLTGDGWLLAVSAAGLALPLVDLGIACRAGGLRLRRPTRAVAGDPTPVRVERTGRRSVETDLVLTLFPQGSPPHRARVHAGCDAAVTTYAASGRGPMPPLRWMADTYGPMGLAARRRHGLDESPVLVHPARAEPVPVALTTAGVGAGGEARHGAGEEPAGVRAFRPGDGPRAVHWRSTARRATPVVLERAVEQAQGLVVAVGRFAAADEPALARAAATVVRCLDRGIPVRLVSAAGEACPLAAPDALDWFALLEPGAAPAEPTASLRVPG
jgi:uncharacterized protein (DUF58 family)